MSDTPYINNVVKMLENKFPEDKSLWNFSNNNELGNDWLIATPADALGKPYSEMKKSVLLKDGPLGLKPCDGAPVGIGQQCVTVDASSITPGQAGEKLYASGAYRIYNEMYKTIISAEKILDITTLSPPTGRFRDAIRNAFTVLSKKKASQKPIIRVLFSNPLPDLPPIDVKGFLDDVTSLIKKSDAMEIYVGILRTTFTSWNHSKIVAADGNQAVVGGHNQWEADYLTNTPTFDVSMKVTGEAAEASHDFAETMWSFMIWRKEHLGQWIQQADMNTELNHHGAYIYNKSSGKNNYIPEAYPPKDVYTKLKPNFTTPNITEHIPVLAMGRSANIKTSYFFPTLWSYFSSHDEPSDEAMLNLFSQARSKIRASLQCLQLWLPNQYLTMPVGPYNEEIFKVWANAMKKYNVDIEVVVSSPDAPPDYFGDNLASVNAKMLSVLKNDFFMEDAPAKSLIKRKFKVGSFRFYSSNKYPNNFGFPNHAKSFVVDDKVYYIGSQNLYKCNLNEYGMVVEEQSKVDSFINSYWNPLWEQSSRTLVDTYSEDLSKQMESDAFSFILELQHNSRLAKVWGIVLEKRKYTTAPVKIREFDQELTDIIHNAGFATTSTTVINLLKSPFFTADRTKQEANADSDRFIKNLSTNKNLLNVFVKILDTDIDNANSQLNNFLSSKGYKCTAQQVITSFNNLRAFVLEFWVGQYETWINTDGGAAYSTGSLFPTSSNESSSTNTRNLRQAFALSSTGEKNDSSEGINSKSYIGPKITVSGNLAVNIDNTPIKNPNYINGVLSWSSSDGNETNGNITFGLVSRRGLAETFIGQEFFGTITYPETETVPKQGTLSFYGQNHQHNAGTGSDPEMNKKNNFVRDLLLSIAAIGLVALMAGFGIKKKREWDEARERRRDQEGGDDEELVQLTAMSDSEEDAIDEAYERDGNRDRRDERRSEFEGLRRRNVRNRQNSTDVHKAGSWSAALDIHDALRNPDFPSTVQQYRERITSAALPWSFVQTSVDNAVSQSIQNQMEESSSDFDTAFEDWFDEEREMSTGFDARNTMDEFARSSLGSELTELDISTRDALIGIEVTTSKYEQITSTSNGSSYLRESASSAYAKQKLHFQNQNATAIQQRLDEATKDMSSTSSELSAKETAFHDVQQALHDDPTNQDLIAKEKDLDRQIDDLIDKQKEEQSRKDEAQREKEQKDREMEENRKEKERADQERESRGNEIFEEVK